MLVFPSLLCTLLFGATSIPGGPGATTRLQEAIDACSKPGCDIELPDADYPMDRQLWIVGKDDVRIRSTGSTAARLRWVDSLLIPDTTGTAILFQMRPPAGGGREDLPAGWLRWPLAAKGGVGTLGDSSHPMSSCGHQHNGMILVKNSRNVRLEGLVLDGIRPAIFANTFIWNGRYDLVHGSVGVGVVQSRGVEIMGGVLRNFWAAVYLNDRNPDCASWTGGSDAKPWTNCGTMGNHLVEGNRIHGNKFGIYSEAGWDLGSVFRDNLAWGNGDLPATETVTSKTAASSNDNTNIAGGFLNVKDVVFPAHVVTRNTISDTGASRPYGWAYFRAAANALWSDNLLEMKGTAKVAYSNPLMSPLHLFTGAKSPHLWNLGLLSGLEGLVNYSGARLVDSSLHWTAQRTVARDTLDGKLAGGLYRGIPGDTIDTLIDGANTRLARVRWVTIFFDTVSFDTTCRTGCWFDLEAPLKLPSNQAMTVWNGKLQGGDSITGRFVIPDGRIVTHKFSFLDICDSTAKFRLRYEVDTVAAWAKNLILSANAKFRSLDPTLPGFLALDTTLAGSRELLRRLGGTRTRIGALGSDGHDFQEPVRLRTRGHGRLDKSKGELALPVSITGRLEGVSRLIARRIWLVARPLDSMRVDASTPDMVERRILPPTLPDLLPADTLIRIPFSDAGADSIYQVDLWLAAIAGNDTLDVTPMAWSAASVMGPSQTTTGIRQKVSASSWRRLGRFLVLDAGAALEAVEFVDARGTRLKLPVHRDPLGLVVDLARLPRGLWIPRLSGARPLPATGR